MKKLETFSIASVITTAFATLFLVMMIVMFYANREVTQSFYTKDLMDYGERHFKSLDTLIQQDLLSGFYPAVVQKTERFMDAEDIVAIRIELADGTVLFDRTREHDAGIEMKRITLNVMSVGSSVNDPDVNHPIATIQADLSLKRVIEKVDAQQKMLAFIWLVGALGGCVLVYFVGLRISLPIKWLKDAVGTRNLAQIAGSNPRSRVTELRNLEAEFSNMGRRLIGAMEHARRNEEFAVIAKTTQMFAHDVRRPFSIFRAGLSLLGSVESAGDLSTILKRLIPEVERATNKVNGLISDIVEVGKPEVHLHKEAMAPRQLIASSVREVFQALPRNDLTLTYDFKFQGRVMVDPLRIGRVLDNIIGNAVQAAGKGERLWFEVDSEGAFCRFTIGNSGSVIEPNVRQRLFQTFFTHGKTNGTGLGLAIADKIVRAHGGSISCDSGVTKDMPLGYVVFQFTIPCADCIFDAHDSLIPLPSNSGEIESIGGFGASDQGGGGNDLSSNTLVSESLPQVVVIEDNVFLAEAWSLKLRAYAQVHSFSTASDFFKALEQSPHLLTTVAIAVVDFHFEGDDKTGFDVAERIAKSAPHTKIILCSDRDFRREDWHGKVHAVISKDPVDLKSLQQL